MPDGDWEKMAPADQDDRQSDLRQLWQGDRRLYAAPRKQERSDRQVRCGRQDRNQSAAERGLDLFVGKANCVSCHKNADFADDKFHNTGY